VIYASVANQPFAQMFRNQYDTDVTTFSPAGRIHQVEYAGEAVKQGAACVGLRSREYVVVATLKRSPSELASFQKKLFKIDDHMGIAISGLIADARALSQWMRTECLNHKYVYETPMETGRLVSELSDKSQVLTQRSDKRPYGVGFLVAGYDQKTGPHLYQTQPSGNWYEYKAQAMGARSQTAKTYLEKNFEKFQDASLGELIRHALVALKGASQGPVTYRNCSVAFVGRNVPFTIKEDDDMKDYVAAIADEEEGGDDDKKEEKKSDSASAAKSDSKSDKSSDPKAAATGAKSKATSMSV